MTTIPTKEQVMQLFREACAAKNYTPTYSEHQLQILEVITNGGVDRIRMSPTKIVYVYNITYRPGEMPSVPVMQYDITIDEWEDLRHCYLDADSPMKEHRDLILLARVWLLVLHEPLNEANKRNVQELAEAIVTLPWFRLWRDEGEEFVDVHRDKMIHCIAPDGEHPEFRAEYSYDPQTLAELRTDFLKRYYL